MPGTLLPVADAKATRDALCCCLISEEQAPKTEGLPSVWGELRVLMSAGTPRGAGTNDSRVASLEAMARDAAASREAMQSEMVLMRKQLNRALEAKAAVDKVLFRPTEIL